MFLSYACSVSALTNLREKEILDGFESFMASRHSVLYALLGLSVDASGYDLIEALHNQCDAPPVAAIRNLVTLNRLGNDLQGLETQLKNSPATALLALSFSTGRNSHSVAVGYDSNHGFCIRDSAQPNGWQVADVAADAVGPSLRQAVEKLDATASCGEAILFIKKTAPASGSNP